MKDRRTSSASHEFATIQELYESCTASQHAYAAVSLLAKCRGYINGVGDMMVLIGAEGNATEKGIFGMCPTDTVAKGAGIQAFKNWAEKLPEMWSKPELVGVMMALSQAWPCH